MNKIKCLVIAGALFAITFTIIFPIIAGETQRSYTRLFEAWNSPSISLVELRDISSEVSQESQNQDLQFAARHLATTAALWIDLGYARLGDLKASGKIEYFGRAFIQGYVNPAINLKTIPLWWNARKFEQAAEALNSRNQKMRLLRWAMAGGIAVGGLCLIGGKTKTSK